MRRQNDTHGLGEKSLARVRTAHLSGFTLIESMVAVAILAILAAIAAPNMIEFLKARHAESAARKIGVGAIFARSEAIKRNAPVLMCAGLNGACEATPASATWAAGWRICYDRNQDGTCDAGTGSDPNPIRVEQALPASVTFRGPQSRLQFNADGTLTSTVDAAFISSSETVNKFKWNVRLAASGASSVRKEAI
jgi:type IV fimbrial biogenesis protein FimT